MNKIFYVILIGGIIIGCSRSQHADNIESEVTTAPAAPAHDYVKEGLDYLKQADAKAAIKSFDEAIRQNPTDTKAYMALGETYMRMQEYTRAIDTFSAASMMAPKDGEILYLLAVNHQMAGNFREAVESAQKSLEIFKQKKDQKSFTKSLALIQDIVKEEKQVKEKAGSPSQEEVKKVQ